MQAKARYHAFDSIPHCLHNVLYRSASHLRGIPHAIILPAIAYHFGKKDLDERKPGSQKEGVLYSVQHLGTDANGIDTYRILAPDERDLNYTYIATVDIRDRSIRFTSKSSRYVKADAFIYDATIAKRPEFPPEPKPSLIDGLI